MKKANREMITDALQELFEEKVYMTMINAADFGVQTRKRLYWTNFKVEDRPKVCSQTWDDVLEPIEDVKSLFLRDGMINCINQKYANSLNNAAVVVKEGNMYRFDTSLDLYKSRWQLSNHSDNMLSQMYTPYPVGKSRPITTSTGNNNIIIDRIDNGLLFIPRKFSMIERERLFWFKDNWTEIIKSKTERVILLGNTVVIKVVEYILNSITCS